MAENIYLGNPNLKKANTEIEFTQEQILHGVSAISKAYKELNENDSCISWLSRENQFQIMKVLN